MTAHTFAACAFAVGYGLLTANVEDFGVLRDAITESLPDTRPLAIAARV